MLAFDQTFTPVAIEIQVAGDADTFTTTADNVVTNIAALVAWANAIARPWFGTRVFAWSWARDPATGGALLTLSASGVFDLNTSTGGLNLPTMAAQTSTTGTDPAQGTWAPTVGPAVSRHVRQIAEGDLSGTGSTRVGVPGLGGLSPAVAAVGTALDSARLAGVLALAASPRRGIVWQAHTASWLTLAIGPVSRSAVGASFRFELETAGVSL